MRFFLSIFLIAVNLLKIDRFLYFDLIINLTDLRLERADQLVGAGLGLQRRQHAEHFRRRVDVCAKEDAAQHGPDVRFLGKERDGMVDNANEIAGKRNRGEINDGKAEHF